MILLVEALCLSRWITFERLDTYLMVGISVLRPVLDTVLYAKLLRQDHGYRPAGRSRLAATSLDNAGSELPSLAACERCGERKTSVWRLGLCFAWCGAKTSTR